jgi:hypothetical protein
MRGLLASEAARQGDLKTAGGLLTPTTPDQPSVVQTVRAMGYDPASPEGRKMIERLEGAGGVNVNVGQGMPDWVPSGYMPRNPNDPREGVTPIPGSEASRKSGSEATQLANARAAVEDVRRAREQLFEGGDIDRWDVISGQWGIPGTQGRAAYQKINRALETILRARSGAAVPPEELRNYQQMYAPSTWDSEEEARDKLDALEGFFKEQLQLMQGGAEPESLENLRSDFATRMEGEEPEPPVGTVPLEE